MKLRLGLKRVGSIVFGRVLEQDDSLRARFTSEGDGGTITKISSISWPELGPTWLKIRGNHKSGDNDWFAYNFDGPRKAEQAIKDIKLIVTKINTGGQQDKYGDCGLEVIE